MITPAEVEQLVLKVIPDAQVRAQDMTGTADHFEITVISKVFEGKSLMDQHKIVFSALEKEMMDRIHAVKIKTRSC